MSLSLTWPGQQESYQQEEGAKLFVIKPADDGGGVVHYCLSDSTLADKPMHTTPLSPRR